MKTSNVVEKTIIGQQRQVVLSAERGDPQVVTEAFAFLETLRHAPNARDVGSDAHVELDGLEIRQENDTSAREIVDGDGILSASL